MQDPWAKFRAQLQACDLKNGRDKSPQNLGFCEMDPEIKFRILLLIFKTHFLQHLRCQPGPAMDPAVLRRALHLARLGGRPRKHGSQPFGAASIIGNDLKKFTQNFSFRIFIDLAFFLAAKAF
jgi:hypothetical protein